jgi:2-oxoisovalerate dehydrogenase E1 component alpha subunit
MLLTRIVDTYARQLYEQGVIDFVPGCYGYEAAQVGSAVCIKVGKDFTLPHYRDLGVVLTIGMTPYEVFRTSLQTHHHAMTPTNVLPAKPAHPIQHWGYHKHNTVTAPTPLATQLLHAAGIAFACKLRKADVVAVAYCDQSITAEPDFLEALRFTAQHQLPIVFICEREHTASPQLDPLLTDTIPQGIHYQSINGNNVVTIYQTMHKAMQCARTGDGPTFIEMHIKQPQSSRQSYTQATAHATPPTETDNGMLDKKDEHDPLIQCQHYLQQGGAWDETWAQQLSARITSETERAMLDALQDPLNKL